MKIFCIGLNKTGTSSLHLAMEMLGFRSLHHAPDGAPDPARAAREIVARMTAAADAGEPMLVGLEDYDAFSDIDPVMRRFDLLDAQYPGSKFVLTERDTDDWLASRARHVERNRLAAAEGRYTGSFLEVDFDAWRREKREHRAAVDAFFRDRPDDLLVIDLCAGEGFEKLCPFLGVPPPEAEFPWANPAPDLDWFQRRNRLEANLNAHAPSDEAVVFIDEDKIRPQCRTVATLLPLPERGGVYFGLPADGPAVIAEIERRRREGVRHLGLAWPSYWWLDRYHGLAEYLGAEAELLLDDDCLRLYRFGAVSGGRP